MSETALEDPRPVLIAARLGISPAQVPTTTPRTLKSKIIAAADAWWVRR